MSDWIELQKQFVMAVSQQTPEKMNSEHIQPVGQLSPAQAIEVYCRDYQYRLSDALAEIFPSIRHWLDDDQFSELCRGYLQKYPSHEYNLEQIGKSLPKYLNNHHFPAWLSELAKVELTFLSYFHSAPHTTIDWESLSTFAPELLVLTPSEQSKLFESHYPLLALWRKEDVKPQKRENRQAFLVYRHSQGVRFASLNTTEMQLWKALKTQRPLAEILEKTAEIPAESITGFFAFLRHEELIQKLSD
jgi:hypothetical protein